MKEDQCRENHKIPGRGEGCYFIAEQRSQNNYILFYSFSQPQFNKEADNWLDCEGK